MEPAMLSARLRDCTAAKRAAFETLRSSGQGEFWDAVVLTATDEAQADAYRGQLAAKVASGAIPKSRYLVVADPSGPKIGNGGATMHALQALQAAHGAELDTWRVLLIHAGGYSKRLPHVSVVGKIFTALPMGDPIFQMLEAKLAMYITFLARMAPGVFVTCADDIELLDDAGDLAFDKPGITALGHPSTLTIGTTHGVFVLDAASIATANAALASSSSTDTIGSQLACTSARCRRFLHKPSEAVMHAAGAPLGPAMDVVYTDSAYFLDRPTAKHLLAFYETHAPLTCEIDAYGDFLQALGPEATDEYCENTANVIDVESDLTRMRQSLFAHLKGTALNVVLCHVSKFYHIGTLPEYVFHLCSDAVIGEEMQLVRHAACVFAGSPPVDVKHCLMQCSLAADAEVAAGAVVEYSRLAAGVRVASGCVVSCCTLRQDVCVPEHIFLHTALLADGTAAAAVLGTREDIKLSAAAGSAPQTLTFCDVSLELALSRLSLRIEDVWPSGKCSLWTAMLFPVAADAAEAAECAVAMVELVRTGSTTRCGGRPLADRRRISFPQMLQEKDLERVLAQRATTGKGAAA